ncbi:hypothetical protein DPV96_06920 [Aggregatibacter segnis]|uniref:Uncharacterized protein n=1 Tax=Haemophilus haemolyticus TaxID=726 RepID=A0AAQ1YQ84_HAEHA|nr:hypothetical protein [Pasteurellaceae]RDE66758.1 hypothetical protein DPV96_06920 [Aggregatibacter segnis]TDN44137.1 hypothetical protein EGH31_0186 [Haemophilus haemolyticus]
MDKYTELRNVTDWIENSSSEEFMSTFNSLGNDYSGVTLGDFVDYFINDDETDETVEYDILTTGNFIFEAEELERNIEKEAEWLSYIFDDAPILSMELIDASQIKLIDEKQECTDLYDAANDEIYDYSLAA